MDDSPEAFVGGGGGGGVGVDGGGGGGGGRNEEMVSKRNNKNDQYVGFSFHQFLAQNAKLENVIFIQKVKPK